MTAQALLFTLACLGISEAVYLIRKRKAQEHTVCIIGEACEQVLESKYNKIFGLHNDILGLVFYILVSLITAFLALEIEPVKWWEVLAKILIFAGVLSSIFFTYLQWRVIKAWCFWCVMSAVTIFLMGIVALFI